MRPVAGRGAVLVTGVLLSVAAIGSAGRAQDEEAVQPPPGAVMQALRKTRMGPVCWAAIVESIRQVGTRCYPGKNAALLAELDQANAQLGAMLLERGWTPEQLEGFRGQMGEADTPTEKLCANADAAQMYRGFASANPADLRATTEAMLARPGPPQWGTCL